MLSLGGGKVLYTILHVYPYPEFLIIGIKVRFSHWLMNYFLLDKAPVIVSSFGDTELNSGAPYTVSCSVQGQPAPLHGEIILLKPDKTIVYVRSSDPHSSGMLHGRDKS